MHILLQELANASMNLFYAVICLSAGLFWPFMICYSATYASSDVNNIGDLVYSSKWYDYPARVRKYVILLVAQSQIPIFFTGFRMIRCNLEVFLKVMNFKGKRRFNSLLLINFSSTMLVFHIMLCSTTFQHVESIWIEKLTKLFMTTKKSTKDEYRVRTTDFIEIFQNS